MSGKSGKFVKGRTRRRVDRVSIEEATVDRVPRHGTGTILTVSVPSLISSSFLNQIASLLLLKVSGKVFYTMHGSDARSSVLPMLRL